MKERTFNDISCPLSLGWVFSRLGLSFLRGYEIGPFVLLPGFLILLIYIFFFLRMNSYTDHKIIYFTNGIIADSVPFWLFRSGTGSSMTIRDPWDINLFISSFISLIVIIVLMLVISKVGKKKDNPQLDIHSKHIFLAFFVCLLVTVAFRVSYLLTRYMPNEERSLMIMGTEIHHAVTGSLILVLVGNLFSNNIRVGWLMLLYGIAAGFILDQMLYLPLSDLSDIAYDSRISWIGVILGNIFFGVSLLFARRRHG